MTDRSFLVAVERNIRRNGVVEYWRKGKEVKSRNIEDFKPFIYCNLDYNKWVTELNGYVQLQGEGNLDTRLELNSWQDYYSTKNVINGYNISYSNCAKQYFSFTGIRLFGNDATFDDLLRLTFDIETTGLTASSSEVILITAKLEGIGHDKEFAFYVGDGQCKSERQVIEALTEVIQCYDVDVLQGHNIYGFDIPFLEERYNILASRKMVWGRDHSELWHGRPRTVKIGANEKFVEMFYCRGRHILDTLLSVQRFDVATQRHSSYGLKAVCRDLGISSEDRIELEREQMTDLWKNSREEVIAYAIQDVEEASRLSNIVHAGEFAQCKLLPDTLGSLCLTGTGEKINMTMIAQYIEEGDFALPIPGLIVPFPGGYVEARHTGKFKNVFKADFESLYPSIMLGYELSPKSDYLGKLLPMLKYWKEERLKQKHIANDPKETEGARRNASGLNEAFKILINSMYGYMGSPFGNFNDMEIASKVTQIGRGMVQEIASQFEEHDLTIIEIDTDGVILSSPEPITEEEEKFLVGCVSDKYEGFTLAHDGRYNQMICLKAKNYILQDYNGKVTIKGASLKNRGMESLYTDFISVAITIMLDETKDNAGICSDVQDYYWETYKRILIGEVNAEEVSRRERISDKTATSPMKKRLASISSHLKEGDYIQVFEGAEREDKTSPLLPIEKFTGAECYNVLYYCKKLNSILKRFEDIYTEENYNFKEMFPTVGKRNLRSIVNE